MEKTTFLAALLTIIGAGCTMAETAQDTTFVVNDKQIVVNEKTERQPWAFITTTATN